MASIPSSVIRGIPLKKAPPLVNFGHGTRGGAFLLTRAFLITTFYELYAPSTPPLRILKNHVFRVFFTQNDENFSKYLLKYEENNKYFSRFLSILFKKENIFRRKPLHSLSIYGDTKRQRNTSKNYGKSGFFWIKISFFFFQKLVKLCQKHDFLLRPVLIRANPYLCVLAHAVVQTIDFA